MDKLLWRMLEVTAGTEIPQVAPEQRLGGALPRWAGFETVLNPPVQGLQGLVPDAHLNTMARDKYAHTRGYRGWSLALT